VFDLVPFLARARREVTDGNREPGGIRELLQLPFQSRNVRRCSPPASAVITSTAPGP